MEIPSVLISDTNGNLSEDLFKIHIDNPAITSWFTDAVAEKRTLNVSLNNVRLDSIPNIANSTYKTFLAYNGTLGYSNKVFSTVVLESSGIFDSNNMPTIVYNPSEVSMPAAVDLDEAVIDIKMYNGTVDILRYSEGILNTGEKSYFVKSVRSFPTVITGLPNVSGNRVFMDGWYSYTTIIFRNIAVGALVVKDTFYGIEGFIFKASDNGQMFKNATTGDIVILRAGDNTVAQGVVQKNNEDYEQMLFSLNETTGISAQANNVYIHSQLMVTDELRDAITAEAVDAAYMDQEDYVDFQTWQKLTLKRMAASVMFQNGLFENAQIILESARAMCTSGKYNTNCR